MVSPMNSEHQKVKSLNKKVPKVLRFCRKNFGSAEAAEVDHRPPTRLFAAVASPMSVRTDYSVHLRQSGRRERERVLPSLREPLSPPPQDHLLGNKPAEDLVMVMMMMMM